MHQINLLEWLYLLQLKLSAMVDDGDCHTHRDDHEHRRAKQHSVVLELQPGHVPSDIGHDYRSDSKRHTQGQSPSEP